MKSICGYAKFNNDNTIINPFENQDRFFSDNFCLINTTYEFEGLKVVFDGSIFNLSEFNDGGNFDCAEKVIARCYRKYGIDAFAKFEGAFAIAIYDVINKEIILARDKIGSKPLYYYFENGELLFSSKLKSLIRSNKVPKVLNKEALSVYLQLTYVPAPFSMIENVYKVMPATAIKLDANANFTTKKYWKLKIEPSEYITDYELAKKQLKEAVFSATEKRLIGNVGALLSGGFDSSIIVGVASKIKTTPIDTFTIKFDDGVYDETELAKLVAEKVGSNHNVIDFRKLDMIEVVDSILEDMDEPYGDSSIIASYAVSKEAKLKVNAVLSGDGGDELFAGYNRYLVSYYNSIFNKVPKFIRSGIIKPISKILPPQSGIKRKVDKFLSVAELSVFEQRKILMSIGFKKEELAMLNVDRYVNNMNFIEDIFNEYPNVDVQTRAQYIDFNVVLEGDMMTKGEKTLNMTGLEVRSPLLDESVVSLSYKLPSNFKIDKKRRKIILKETFADLLPQELFTARKHGFGVPMERWLVSELKNLLLKYTSEDYISRQGLFNYRYINNLAHSHIEKKQNKFSELWAFIVFQNWYEKVFM
jgi:asparagine synthase (glutamine-hydrolysing)